MSDGEALRWRKNYMETEIKGADGAYVWPTKADFLETFKTAFLNKDEKEESIRKLDNISQGNRTAEEYVNKFRLTVSKAGLSTNNDMMVRTFRKGLNRALATRILYFDKKPDRLDDRTVGTDTKKGWYSTAIEFNRIHRDNVLALGERPDKPTGRQPNYQNKFRQVYGRGYASGPAYQRGNYQPQPQNDPNAMDIDVVTTAINAMSYEERGEFLRKELCFYCKQPGHVSRNCPEKKKLYQNQQNNNHAPAQRNDNRAFAPRNNNPFRNVHDTIKKVGPRDINKMIRALTTEEREEMFELEMAEGNNEERGLKERDFI